LRLTGPALTELAVIVTKNITDSKTATVFFKWFVSIFIPPDLLLSFRICSKFLVLGAVKS
jgi:hypothetical protein